MLDAKIDEVCVDEYMVGWTKLRVMFEEHSDFLLFHLFDLDGVDCRCDVVAPRIVFLPLVLFNFLAAIVNF